MQTFTPIAPMYDTDGIRVVNPSGTTLMGAASTWDTLILELRKGVHEIMTGFLSPPQTPTWRLGNLNTLDPGLVVGKESDAFYVSHIKEVRDYINAIETAKGYTVSTWSFDPLAPRYDSNWNEIEPNFTDVRDQRLIAELQTALITIQTHLGGTVLPPTNVTIKLKLTGTVIGQ